MAICGRNSPAEVILPIIFERRYTRLNEDESSSNSPEASQRNLVDGYPNYNYVQRRYSGFYVQHDMSYVDKTNIRPSTRLGNENNFALHVIRHLMCQMVKTAEEADAAYEFITNLANNLKPKLRYKRRNGSESCSNTSEVLQTRRIDY
ncbi:hypothetical protein HZH68_016253 [Vespula germanica]|uniref:Uncharacterized protein n=1 Tax=Vespula germanica TaxID=30212 RepID=A0A834MRK7_VESGE|nr:hypothetical protein HZH68_016253 [Vespula germanica]